MVMNSRAVSTERKLNRRHVLLGLLIKMIWAWFSNFVLNLDHLETVLCGDSKSTDLKALRRSLPGRMHRAQHYVAEHVRCPSEDHGLQRTVLPESLGLTLSLQMPSISVTFFSLQRLITVIVLYLQPPSIVWSTLEQFQLLGKLFTVALLLYLPLFTTIESTFLISHMCRPTSYITCGI